MDRSRKPRDTGKGIAKSGDRSQSSSPERDPRRPEGYTGGKGTSGSSPKRARPFNPLDALPALSKEDMDAYAPRIDPHFELNWAMEQSLDNYNQGKRKQPLLQDTGKTNEQIEQENMAKAIEMSKREHDQKYSQDMKKAIMASRNPFASEEDSLFANEVTERLKGAETSKEQAKSESEPEDYGDTDSDVSQPEYDVD